MTNETNISADELKKGTWIQLTNGLFAMLMDNEKGKERIAEVQGQFVELGYIGSSEIERAKINGEWLELSHDLVKKSNSTNSF
jgi:hypothetical protein